MSTPLPNPPHEKVAVEVGVAHFANPGVPHLQLKSPSADRPAMGHNTSQLPDIEQPPRVVADTEPGQGIVQYEQYGAWSSSTGAQRGAPLLSSGRPEAPPHNHQGAAATLSADQRYGGKPSVFTEMCRMRQDHLWASMMLQGKAEVPSCNQPKVTQATRESLMAKARTAKARLVERVVSGAALTRTRELQGSPTQMLQQTCTKVRYDKEHNMERSSEYDVRQPRQRERYDINKADPTVSQVYAAVASELQQVEHRLAQQLDERVASLVDSMQDTTRVMQNSMQQILAPVWSEIQKLVLSTQASSISSATPQASQRTESKVDRIRETQENFSARSDGRSKRLSREQEIRRTGSRRRRNGDSSSSPGSSSSRSVE